MKEYNRARVYLDENYRSQEHFTVSASVPGHRLPKRPLSFAGLLSITAACHLPAWKCYSRAAAFGGRL